MKTDSYLIPDWPIAHRVKAVCTTRLGGVSEPPFDSFNLGDHVEDELSDVAINRRQLQADLKLVEPIQFLNQVHGIRAVNLAQETERTADAAYTQNTQQVCAVLTADCLPLLVCNREGTEVAAIHAGWRGLLAGVIDETIKQFQAPHSELLVWLGPSLKSCHFEVNEAMRDSFLQKDPNTQSTFQYHADTLFSDLHELAKINLHALGIQAIYGGTICSHCEDKRFYSYRRDQGQTGRFASLIWIEPTNTKNEGEDFSRDVFP